MREVVLPILAAFGENTSPSVVVDAAPALTERLAEVRKCVIQQKTALVAARMLLQAPTQYRLALPIFFAALAGAVAVAFGLTGLVVHERRRLLGRVDQLPVAL